MPKVTQDFAMLEKLLMPDLSNSHAEFIGRGGMSFRFDEVKIDLSNLARATDRSVENVLKKSGAYIRRAMKTVLRKKRRKYKKKLTPIRKWRKDGTMSSHYVQFLKEYYTFVGAGHPRPPKQFAGTLRNLVEFSVDTSNHSLVVGPRIFSQKNTKANIAPPRLLDQGGLAQVRVQVRRGEYKYLTRRFRKFEFVSPAWEKSRAGVSAIMEQHLKIQ